MPDGGANRVCPCAMRLVVRKRKGHACVHQFVQGLGLDHRDSDHEGDYPKGGPGPCNHDPPQMHLGIFPSHEGDGARNCCHGGGFLGLVGPWTSAIWMT